ncbi:hypothetical protein SESBI_07836 [Sesbania bispinosa]|nr:hypothetical protein SESBI_07836 [Sesbania bispinosa]
MIQIPTLQIPDWDTSQSDVAAPSPFSINDTFIGEDFDVPIHPFSTDQFRMFEFKVRNCQRGRSHDWTECPYAHPGEKARRRDPRNTTIPATPALSFAKETARKLCKDGTACRRRVCFFAHTAEQLRLFVTHASHESFLSSPTSVLNSSPLSDSPPRNSRYGVVLLSVGEIVGSMRNVQIEEGNSGSARGTKMGCVIGSPRGTLFGCEEEPAMERVESGRDLRARIYAKLSRENSMNAAFYSAPIPDIGWVSELVK